MASVRTSISRRKLLGAIGASAAVGLPLSGRTEQLSLPKPSASTSPATLARDEAFWSEVATNYDRTAGIVNLEHGYWGTMAHPVQNAYIDATRMVNAQNSFYARKQFETDEMESVRRVARALGVHDDEIVLTRNATESIHNLIRQYRGLAAGDAILYADIDYPHFKTAMRWLEDARGARPVELIVPPRMDQAQIFALYRDAFDRNPDLKLMLLMHVSNQHGLVLPVARITEEARKRGIDVICDTAQSWGLLDYRVPSLKVDWAGFNLHKWIGTPVGVGALYMRRGSLHKVAPYPGESDPEDALVSTRVHVGTSNFAAVLAVPHALDFHEAIGGENKEARLRYLRQLWTRHAESMSHIELLGGLDEASWTGMGSFRLAGKRSVKDVAALQQRLEQEFGIFTVVRKGLASGYCVRITPQVFSTPDDMAQLVDALKRLV
ncbi:MAG: aminotransferase class V-fold PLP-dependent enzyme [Woeseiaceae bacterium]|nr:aminotransferase class V-fold PLP-dependent enzyme [Woeseiaceae bacterium]MDX2608837.1 aminotransferase class V-fold PLP-dependent enzyme [Woeseiaceae bacterium]